jgi:hypothetical protein
MSLPVGLAGRSAHNPASLTAGLTVRRPARSTRQKISNAGQITLLGASIRRLFLKNMGATARGPLKLPQRRSTASWPFAAAQDLRGVSVSGVKVGQQGVPAVGGGVGVGGSLPAGLSLVADTSLRVNYLNVTTFWPSLCPHAAGHTNAGPAGHEITSALPRGRRRAPRLRRYRRSPGRSVPR